MVHVSVLDYTRFENIVENILRDMYMGPATQNDVKLLECTENDIELWFFMVKRRSKNALSHHPPTNSIYDNKCVFDPILRLPNRVGCRSSSKCVFIVGLWSEMIISVNVCHYYYCGCRCYVSSSNTDIGIYVIPCKGSPAYEKNVNFYGEIRSVIITAEEENTIDNNS